MKKRTVIIGATTNPSRYAYMAAHRLREHGHDIVNVGIKKGEVAGVSIESLDVIHEDIDTVTLYVGPARQPLYYDYILKTRPKRVVFNPGTENEELMRIVKQEGIEATEACTLVLLNTGQY